MTEENPYSRYIAKLREEVAALQKAAEDHTRRIHEWTSKATLLQARCTTAFKAVEGLKTWKAICTELYDAHYNSKGYQKASNAHLALLDRLHIQQGNRDYNLLRMTHADNPAALDQNARTVLDAWVIMEACTKEVEAKVGYKPELLEEAHRELYEAEEFAKTEARLEQTKKGLPELIAKHIRAQEVLALHEQIQELNLVDGTGSNMVVEVPFYVMTGLVSRLT
ncbi:Hypothetical protein POVN_LOCUS181 [uncultured virus]|nr:Hypothetical protein POVN_LOCUS181 [uncultured virus]